MLFKLFQFAAFISAPGSTPMSIPIFRWRYEKPLDKELVKVFHLENIFDRRVPGLFRHRLVTALVKFNRHKTWLELFNCRPDIVDALCRNMGCPTSLISAINSTNMRSQGLTSLGSIDEKINLMTTLSGCLSFNPCVSSPLGHFRLGCLGGNVLSGRYRLILKSMVADNYSDEKIQGTTGFVSQGPGVYLKIIVFSKIFTKRSAFINALSSSASTSADAVVTQTTSWGVIVHDTELMALLWVPSRPSAIRRRLTRIRVFFCRSG